MTPQADRLLRYFEHDHLPEPLRSLSAKFSALAHEIAAMDCTDGPEQTVALRKLLEAKDCAVRSILGINASRAGEHVPPETLGRGHVPPEQLPSD
jgi:hypothetical protein